LKKIKIFEYDCILFFLTQGLNLGIISTLIKKVNTNIIFIPIIGMIIGFIPLIIYMKNLDLNINQLNTKFFGKTIGNIINFLIIILVTMYALSSFSNLINFIKLEYLYDTPKLFISIIFTIPIIYILSKDITVISRTIVILFFIEIFLFILSFIGVTSQININELLPLFQTKTTSIIESSLIYVSYIVIPIFLLKIFKKEDIQNNKNIKKHIIISYILSNIIAFIIIFSTVSVLGTELISIYKYPEFQILKKVTLGGFIQRIESILSIHFIINLFVFTSFCFYYIKTTLPKFKLYSGFIIIICIISTYTFKNNYINLSFIIPLLILVTSKKVVKLLYK